jgi:solute carrier family 10 (sodium/bile acid cotransporter), member 7
VPRIDPMVRLLLLAIALATALPVSEAWHEAAQLASNAAVFVLFFLNGVRLPRREVIAGIGKLRLIVPLVAWVFGAMTAAGWLLWHAGQGWAPPLVALGFLYLGTLPSTVQSATAYSSLAGGNVASSVVAAALLNILGVFVTAPLFAALAGTAAVAQGAGALVKVMTILLLPFVLGQALQGRLHGWVTDHRGLVTWMDRGSIAIAVYVAFSGAVEQGIWTRVDGRGWAAILAGCALLLGFAHGGAWLLGAGLRLARGDRVALLFAGAQKSIAMGAPLATVLFPPAVAGVVLLPALVYHLAQLVIAAPLAGRLAAGGARTAEPDRTPSA